MTTNKKITLATLKSFIRKNRENLLIRNDSNFDGMTDCVQQNTGAAFQPAKDTDMQPRYTLGILGIWVVGGSRNSLSSYESETMKGIRVSNCCGSFVVAVPATAAAA